jgi:large subunit ribosomal protein L19e
MSVRFTKRAAASLMGRGETSIRIKEGSVADAEKAITTEDVRDMIKKGLVYAIAKKRNLSLNGKSNEKQKRKGRRMGAGKRKGTIKARAGVPYKQRVRAQRRLLARLKDDKALNNEQFKMLYALVKGGTFSNKITLLNRIRSEGIQITDENLEKLRHI